MVRNLSLIDILALAGVTTALSIVANSLLDRMLEKQAFIQTSSSPQTTAQTSPNSINQAETLPNYWSADIGTELCLLPRTNHKLHIDLYPAKQNPLLEFDDEKKRYAETGKYTTPELVDKRGHKSVIGTDIVVEHLVSHAVPGKMENGAYKAEKASTTFRPDWDNMFKVTYVAEPFNGDYVKILSIRSPLGKRAVSYINTDGDNLVEYLRLEEENPQDDRVISLNGTNSKSNHLQREITEEMDYLLRTLNDAWEEQRRQK